MYKYFCLLLSVLIFSSCSHTSNQNSTTDKPNIREAAINQVVGIGKIEPESDIIQLSSQVNGIVQQILKKENDTVNVGIAIVELDHQLEDTKVKQLISEVNTQSNQIKADEAGIEEFSAKYNNALSELKRLQKLLEMGAETRQAVDDATANLKTYESNLKRLQANVQVSRSKLIGSKAGLQLAEVEREQKIVKSPVKGKILEISTLIGSAIDTRQSFVQISPLCKTIALCEIDELYADKIEVGQKAWIRNVGSLDTLATGTVYFAYSFLKKKSLFTDQSGEKEDRRVRTIKIMLDNPERLLLNARVECVIAISAKM